MHALVSESHGDRILATGSHFIHLRQEPYLPDIPFRSFSSSPATRSLLSLVTSAMAALSGPPMGVTKVLGPNIAAPMARKTTQKARTSVSFPGNAKFPRVGAVPGESLDLYQVLRCPYMEP